MYEALAQALGLISSNTHEREREEERGGEGRGGKKGKGGRDGLARSSSFFYEFFNRITEGINN
jgi:hypothetical protein